jgi:hypothetical protein
LLQLPHRLLGSTNEHAVVNFSCVFVSSKFQLLSLQVPFRLALQDESSASQHDAAVLL